MLMTVKEYAEVAGIGIKAVYRQIKEDRLPPGVKAKKIYGRRILDVKNSHVEK